jgi:VWFA-related protein
VAILLDEPNMLATAGTDVYQQMAKSLSSLHKGEANLMVLLVDLKGVRLAHEITDDPAVLSQWLSHKDKSGIRVLQNQAPSGSVVSSGLDTIVGTYFIRTQTTDSHAFLTWPLFTFLPGSMDRGMVLKAIMTVDAMQQTVQALAGIPGQRSVVWVTGQIPFNFHHSEQPKENRELPAEFLNTMAALDREGIDLTLIETYLGSYGSSTSNFAVGLTAPDRYGVAQVMTGSSISTNMTAGTMPVLNDFAKPIGSKVYWESTSLGKAISEMAKDSSATYRIRFTAEPDEIVNGWVPAEITSNRTGIAIASRSGHYVSSYSDPLETRIYDIRMGVRSPLQFTGLPLQASFGQPQPLADGKRTIPFHVFVPPGHIACDEKRDNLVLADLAYQVVDANGKEVLAKVNPQQANLKPEQRAVFLAQGLNLDRSFDLPSGTYTVRFIVRDNLGGKVGTVFAPLKVE